MPAGDSGALPSDRDVASLARRAEAAVVRGSSSALLHHLALYFAHVARALEAVAPDGAKVAWRRALAAWFALADERTYLEALTRAVLGEKNRALAAPPAQMPVDLVEALARRAEQSARDLSVAGQSALLGLGEVAAAARLAGISPEAAEPARLAASRARDAVIDASVGVVGEALDEANVRGQLAASGPGILRRTLDIWRWAANDETVEHFVVDRLATIGWEIYREKDWQALADLLDPFRPMIESLAARIEADPSKIAYAAACAQMFVFLAEVDTSSSRKLASAERALRICPTHRNGRLILASILIDQARARIAGTDTFFPRKDELAWAEALLDRAEKLYPRSTYLATAREELAERRKRGFSL